MELQGEKISEKRMFVDPDNSDNAEMARFCPSKGKHILNPIIDWTTEDVWEFIKQFKLPYCTLYDEGFKRLGCIGCPTSTKAYKELERYPKFKRLYLRAFERMLLNMELKQPDKKRTWKTAEDVMEWWILQIKKERENEDEDLLSIL